MRPLALGRPTGRDTESRLRWIEASLRQIEEASRSERSSAVADAFSPENVVDTRTFDAASATLADLRNVLGTFLADLRRGGARRG